MYCVQRLWRDRIQRTTAILLYATSMTTRLVVVGKQSRKQLINNWFQGSFGFLMTTPLSNVQQEAV